MEIVAIIVGLFGLGAIFGAPWLPTRNREAELALDLLDLRPGETVIDLGSGSGSFALAAAKRQLQVIGYEINPILWAWSRLRTWRYRRRVTLYLRNYWSLRLPTCEGVYVFLITGYMPKLARKLEAELQSPVRVVSYAFTIPNKPVAAEKAGLYLYQY